MKDSSLSDPTLEHNMESLENKLDRLPPEQRKEVEDFVDFLLFRSGNIPAPTAAVQTPVSFQNVAPPPLFVQEPAHVPEPAHIQGNDSYLVKNSPNPLHDEEQVQPIQEIIVGGEDRITHDYMDYGQFEQKSSPATIAVKNVKEKLQKQKEQEKPRVMLDWID
jgi:hypothetical protein